MRRALEWLGGSVLVYALMAACSGGAKTAATSTPDGAAGEMVAGVGGAPNAAGGAPGATAEAGSGGLLDPVPDAGAQEAGAGPGPNGPALSYIKSVVDCESTIMVAGTDYPAATLTIEPASLLVASATISVSEGNIEGWFQAGNALVKPNGSEVGVLCNPGQETATFFVPNL